MPEREGASFVGAKCALLNGTMKKVVWAPRFSKLLIHERKQQFRLAIKLAEISCLNQDSYVADGIVMNRNVTHTGKYIFCLHQLLTGDLGLICPNGYKFRCNLLSVRQSENLVEQIEPDERDPVACAQLKIALEKKLGSFPGCPSPRATP